MVTVTWVAVVFVFHLVTFRPDPWWGDSLQYVMHAQNIVAGEPYARTNYVQSPNSFVAPTAYPIGYPFLIAPVIAVFGPNPRAVAVVNLVFLVFSAWVVGVLGRRTLSREYAVAVSILVALQPGLAALARAPYSDLVFVAMVMSAVVAAETALEEPSRRRSDGWAVAAGIALGLATTTRTLGVVLVPAFVVVAILHPSRPVRPMVIATSVGVAVTAALSFYDIGTPLSLAEAGGRGGGYPLGGEATVGYGRLIRDNLLAQLSEVPGRILESSIDYLRASFPLWDVEGARPLKHILFIASAVPVGIGFIARVQRGIGPAETFAVLYVLALLPWSFSVSRYLFGVYPLYYFYLAVGIDRLGAARPGRRRALGVALAAAVVLSYGSRYVSWAVAPPADVISIGSAAAYDEVRDRTPEGALVVTNLDPRFPAYHAGRPSVIGPRELAAWPAFAERVGATHALVDRAGAALDSIDDRYRLVYESEELSLFAFCETPRPASGRPGVTVQ